MTNQEMELRPDGNYHGRLADGREIVVTLDAYNEYLQDRTPISELDNPEEWLKVAGVNPGVTIVE